MICPDEFLKFLKKKKITFFTGVPDSVLEDFLEKVSKLNFTITLRNLLRTKSEIN